MDTNKLINFFDSKAKERDKWIRRNNYYNKKIVDFMKFHIPSHKTVLEIGCGTGFLLNALSPSKGVGIDFSNEMIKIASNKYPHLQFINANALDYKLKDIDNYMLLCSNHHTKLHRIAKLSKGNKTLDLY